MTPVVSAIHVYPVKSLGGISPGRAWLGASGFRFDRGWMAAKPDGTFLTQRSHPQMALVQTTIEDDRLVLSSFGLEDHTVPESNADMRRFNTEVWGDRVNALDTGDLSAEWLSQAIGEPCRLLVFPQNEIRLCDQTVARPGDHTRFADGFPLLVVSQASLDDLNSRLATPVAMNRFRPNLVVSGSEPYEEDRWQRISINGIRMRLLEPCARCSVPTVDPETGNLAGPEPIHTLSQYRQRDGEVFFGVNAAADGEGEISVGDRLTVDP